MLLHGPRSGARNVERKFGDSDHWRGPLRRWLRSSWGRFRRGSSAIAEERERALVRAALAAAEIDLSTTVPVRIERHREKARGVIAEVERIYGAAAESDYFKTSKLRYEQYFAIASDLEPGARVLEIGSSPGHVSVGLMLMGFQMTCLNRDALYRGGYPSPDWLQRLNVVEHDFEKTPLPFADQSFDIVFFTEVLEHVAIKPVIEVLRDIRRCAKPGATLVLSTPNVNNLSNVFALLKGQNIFWRPEMFYGSLDRHNREYSPEEVKDALVAAGFTIEQFYGFNCHSNWRAGGIEQAYRAVAELGDNHSLLRNTIMAIARA
jgi:2-polyprenyl-3-methyl-5-hydroxy-6-metoxy-1,4-benzoquinol methylase